MNFYTKNLHNGVLRLYRKMRFSGYEVWREALSRTNKIAKIQFYSFYIFKPSGKLAISIEIKASKHMLTICDFFRVSRKKCVMCAILEFMTNRDRYLVALTTVISGLYQNHSQIRKMQTFRRTSDRFNLNLPTTNQRVKI